MVTRPDPLIKDYLMDMITRKTSFEQVFSQLEEVESLLLALSDWLFDDQLQNEIELDSISVSHLSRKLREIPPEIFQSIFLDLVAQFYDKTHYSKLVLPLKIIDSSTLRPSLTNHRWAEFRKTEAGVKLHLRLVFMDKGISYP